MKSSMKRKKGMGCISALFIIAVVICSVVYVYKKNPSGFMDRVNIGLEQFQNYASQIKNGENNSIPQDNIEFPEEEKLTEAQKYYFYQQLGETGKKIYITIENNIENFKDGKENIPLPSSVNEIAKTKGKEYVAEEFQNAWDAFIIDRSEFFYLDSSKVCLQTKIITQGKDVSYEFSIGKGENKNYFTDGFSNKEDVEKAVKQVQQVKNQVLKGATGSNYEKMKYVHNWLIDNVNYSETKTVNSSNIYGALVGKSVVCEGYARAYKYLMDELNIPCVLVSGTAVDENGKSERHAWNYVYIKNNWFAIDTTWDDPIIIGNGTVKQDIKYKYFLRGSNTMNKDHTSSGQITKQGFNFKYPELSSEDIK